MYIAPRIQTSPWRYYYAHFQKSLLIKSQEKSEKILPVEGGTSKRLY